MSSLAEIDDVTALSDAELGLLLNRLEREERNVSKRRRQVHDRIDFVQAGGFAAEGSAEEQLSRLQVTAHRGEHGRQGPESRHYRGDLTAGTGCDPPRASRLGRPRRAGAEPRRPP
jgi:hypothetical protein